ncbi:protein BatD [bacterium]|nr:protein BatD [bacterium]
MDSHTTLTGIAFTGNRTRVILLGLALLLLCVPIVPARLEAFSIDAQVSRQKLSIQDQLQFSIIVSDDKSKNLPQPELPYEFEGFSVLTGPNHQTSIQIINFAMTASSTYTYILAPLKVGTLTLPVINVSWQGQKYTTKPIQIEVVDAPAGSAAGQTGQAAPSSRQGQQQVSDSDKSFFRLEVSKKKVFVGEQILLQYVLYTRERVENVGFQNMPSLTGFWVEDIEMNQIMQSESTIDGVPYNRLLLKQQLLFPTSSGEQTIEPIGLQLQVGVQVQNQRRGRSLFDGFFNDPFFSTRTQTKLENSLPIIIDVQGLPAGQGKPENFNGLVGEYQARASINKTEVKRDDSVTFSVSISGQGNVQNIPEPVLPELDDVKLYSPTVSKKVSKTSSGVTGSKTFEYIIVPRCEGQLVIPSIEIPYFSPTAHAYKLARTQPLTLNVLPSEHGQESPLIVLAPTTAKSELTLLGQDINYIKVGLGSIGNQGDYLIQKPWFWLLHMVPVGLIGLVALVRWRQRSLLNDVAGTRSRKARNVAKKYLKAAAKALHKNDTANFFQVLGKGISTYIADKLNISAAGMTTDLVRDLLSEREVSEEVQAQILEILHQCDFARFAPASISKEDMHAAFEKARAAINTLDRQKLKKKS